MSEFKHFEYTTQILEQHLDTFGHVNNAKYLELYEEARWDFISKNNYGLKEILEIKKGPIVLEVSCKFKREIVNRETILIKTHTAEWKGKIGKITQVMIKEDGGIASEAIFTIGFMDFKLRKLIKPTDEWMNAIGIE